MICYKCGEKVGKEDFCPTCNADLSIFQRAVRISNEYYNDGLQKANVRNLSGAIVSLKKSLKIYKYNTEARNLLGLVYYEVGEVVSALSEWVISTSYQPNDNKASQYLREIHNNRNQLEAINQTIKKYNQALMYCKQGSRDLAIIQLKKVLSLNSKLVRGHQLLALLYLQERQYDKAKKSLRNAGKIDTDNTTTLRYLKEVNRCIKEDKKYRKTQNTDDLISYQSGNEMIIMPKRFRESSLGATLLYILLGIIVGISVTWFLVVPGIKDKAAENAKNKLLEANDTITTDGQTITGLEKDIEDLQKKLDEVTEDNEEVKNQMKLYEGLMTSFTKYTDGDVVALGDTLNEINTKYLSKDAKKSCDKLKESIKEPYLEKLYDTGYSYYNNGNWKKGIEAFNKVTKIDKDYKDGSAVYYLAQCLRLADKKDEAKKLYKYIIENYPGTQKARTAENYVNEE